MARLFHTKIVHRRLSPRRHSLKARVAYVLLDLEAERSTFLFGMNRRGLFSFQPRDHGSGEDLANLIRARGMSSGADCSGKILLLTVPRLLGYAFNPVSVFVCHDGKNEPSASIFEVSNFHGERHYYVNRITPGAARQVHSAQKEFHVSPFLGLNHTYRFVLELSETDVHFAITEYEHDEPILYARMAGQGSELTDQALVGAALAYPLQSFRIVGSILFEAAKLWVKRIPIHAHPGSRHRQFTLARKI